MGVGARFSGGVARSSLNPRLPAAIPSGSGNTQARTGIVLIFETFFEPVGFEAFSRWLRSGATTPPERKVQKKMIFLQTFRQGCRSFLAQPPATGCDPFGIGNQPPVVLGSG